MYKEAWVECGVCEGKGYTYAADGHYDNGAHYYFKKSCDHCSGQGEFDLDELAKDFEAECADESEE